MTTTHSIDLNLDLTLSHGVPEAAIDSLVASGLVGAGVPARPQPDGLSSASSLTSLPPLTPLTSLGVAGERDARPYQALAGGDVRDMSGVSDARPAVAGERDARPYQAADSTSVAAFRRAMAEPIAENAALGEAFAAAVAATGAVGRDDPIAPMTEANLTRSHGGTEAGEEASSLPSLTPLTSPDMAASADEASLSSLGTLVVAGGDVRDESGDSDARPASPAVATDSPDTAAASPLSSHSSATPALVEGDVRDVRVVSDMRPASPAVAPDSLDSAVAVGRDILVSPERSEHREAMSLEACAPTAKPATVAGGDVRDARVVSDVRPSAEQSRRATEPGDESSSLASLPSLDPSLTSPSPLTPLTSPAAAAAAASASTPDVAPAASPSSSAVLVQAAEAVADTLLVSPGLLRGQGEIVVQLRPDVLDGTEVRIAVTGRHLDVQFCPTSVDMAVMLENGRAQIASHLSAKIASFNVTVDVRKKRA